MSQILPYETRSTVPFVLMTDTRTNREQQRTAWDAIGDLPSVPNGDLAPSGRWADLLASIPEGQNYLWHTDRGGGLPLFGWRRRYWSFLLKLAKDQPSWTIQAEPGPATGPFHWDSRLLSTRELCRLQTIPDDVQIAGDRRAVQRQIGNAVPSLLAEEVARAVREQLLDGKAAVGLPLCSRQGEERSLNPSRSPSQGIESAGPAPPGFLKPILAVCQVELMSRVVAARISQTHLGGGKWSLSRVVAAFGPGLIV